MEKRFFALLERDRVDDRPALHALESSLDHFPFRRIDHHRNARDIRLCGDQIHEARHRRLRIEHRLVHVDVDHLGAVLHLRTRDLDGAGEIAREDQAGKCARTGNVGPLADIDEQRIVADRERLKARETHDP